MVASRYVHLLLACAITLSSCADNATVEDKGDVATSFVSEINTLLDKDRGRVVERVAFLGAGVIGLTGYFVKYCLDKRREQRLWKIDRISRQLEEFYGPLHYGVFAQQARFKAMLRMYAKDVGKNFDDQGLFDAMVLDLSQDEMRGNGDSAASKLWMDFINQFAIPLNRQHAEILTKKGHLYDGHYPEAFKLFLKHAADLELMAKRWEQRDFSMLNQQFRYPVEMDWEIERKLYSLTTIKAELLGSEDMQTRKEELRRGNSTLYMQSSMDPFTQYQESSPGFAEGEGDEEDGKCSDVGDSPHSRPRRAVGKGAGRGEETPLGGLPPLSRSAHSQSQATDDSGEQAKASCRVWGHLCSRMFPTSAASSAQYGLLSRGQQRPRGGP